MIVHLRHWTDRPPREVGVSFFCGERLSRKERGSYTTDPNTATCEACLREWRRANR